MRYVLMCLLFMGCTTVTFQLVPTPAPTLPPSAQMLMEDCDGVTADDIYTLIEVEPCKGLVQMREQRLLDAERICEEYCTEKDWCYDPDERFDYERVE
jgi:hypothetical protein